MFSFNTTEYKYKSKDAIAQNRNGAYGLKPYVSKDIANIVPNMVFPASHAEPSAYPPQGNASEKAETSGYGTTELPICLINKSTVIPQLMSHTWRLR